MQIGVTFPQTEIGADPVVIRDYVQAIEALGYQHLIIYDHVLGVDPAQYPGWNGPYTYKEMFHEPFVLFGYLAAVTQLELTTAVIILPQRQTVLVAKQTAEIDVLTGGKLRLGVGLGWNAAEYEALGMDFKNRGRMIEEQIEVMRLLWKQEIVNFRGKYHTITGAGLNPLPIHRTIPVWMGGSTDKVLRRTARLADGWFPLGLPDAMMRQAIDNLHRYLQQEGRDPASLGIEAAVNTRDGNMDELVRQTEEWRTLGATHISINTMGSGFTSPTQHIEAIRRYKDAIHATSKQH